MKEENYKTYKTYYYYISNDYFGFDSNDNLVCEDSLDLGLADYELKGTANSIEDLKKKITNLLLKRGALRACYDGYRRFCDNAVVYLQVSLKPINEDLLEEFNSSITIYPNGELKFYIFVERKKKNDQKNRLYC